MDTRTETPSRSENEVVAHRDVRVVGGFGCGLYVIEKAIRVKF